MKDYIYCKTIAKGKQSFYLVSQGKEYFLFVQTYKSSNKEVYEHGVPLFDLRKVKKHHSKAVSHTAKKLPIYIQYIEREYGIMVMEKTKRKHPNYRSRGLKFINNYIPSLSAA